MAVRVSGAVGKAGSRPGPLEIVQDLGIALIVGLSVAGMLLVYGAPLGLAAAFGAGAAVAPLVFGLVARNAEGPEAP
jgi:hypothetical protein